MSHILAIALTLSTMLSVSGSTFLIAAMAPVFVERADLFSRFREAIAALVSEGVFAVIAKIRVN